MSLMCCLPSRIREIDSILFAPNPYEVDITHFELHHLLGGGGFGIVQYVTKVPLLPSLLSSSS
jgi:hypothetical protein